MRRHRWLLVCVQTGAVVLLCLCQPRCYPMLFLGLSNQVAPSPRSKERRMDPVAGRVADFSGGQVSRSLPTESREVKRGAPLLTLLRSGLPNSRHRYCWETDTQYHWLRGIRHTLFRNKHLTSRLIIEVKQNTVETRGLPITCDPRQPWPIRQSKDAMPPTHEESRL